MGVLGRLYCLGYWPLQGQRRDLKAVEVPARKQNNPSPPSRRKIKFHLVYTVQHSSAKISSSTLVGLRRTSRGRQEV